MAKKLLKLAKTDLALSVEQREYLKFFIGFSKELIETRITKADFLCQLGLVAEIVRNGEFVPESFKDWKGNILVVTSNTDTNFKYHERLKSQFPNVEDIIYENTGHIGTLIKEMEFLESIKSFMKE